MVSCFYPKADKRGKAERRAEAEADAEEGKVQKFSAILNVRADRKGHPSRKEQVQHLGKETGGKQSSFRRSRSIAEESPVRPFSSITDLISSVSERFSSSTRFSRGSFEITEVGTDGWATGKDDKRTRKKFQSGSFRKLVSSRSTDNVPTEAAAESSAESPDDAPSQGSFTYELDELSQKHLALLLAPADIDDMPELQENKSQELQPPDAPKPSHLDLPVPKNGTDSPNGTTDILAHPQAAELPGSLENPPLEADSEFSIQTSSELQATSDLPDHSDDTMITAREEAVDQEGGTIPSETKSDWERTLERTLANMTDSPATTHEIEEVEEEIENADNEVVEPALTNSSPVGDWQDTPPRQKLRNSRPGVQRSKTEKVEIEEKEDVEKARPEKRDAQYPTISKRVALWLGRSRVPMWRTPAPERSEKADKHEEIVQLAPISQPLPEHWRTGSIPVDSNTAPGTENLEEAHDDAENGIETLEKSVPKSIPVDSNTAPRTENSEEAHDDAEKGIETLEKSVPESIIPVDSNTAPRTENLEEAHDDAEKGIDTLEKAVPNSPPVPTLDTKLEDANHDSGVSPTASGNHDDCDHEIVRTASVPEAAPRLSSVSDNEAVARLWEQLDMMVDEEQKTPGAREAQAAEEKLMATGKEPTDAAARTQARRRRVRFSTCGCSDDVSVVDISATLLGKLSATKHHQIRYLQDELKKTRAQVAQLEKNFEAQRDLKVAFKVQAVRLGSALKKLRQFALENGLDPRGLDGSFSLGTLDAQLESQDTTKENNYFPALTVLKTQARESGWLCDPKDVELREHIGSGSTADIFKGVWQNLDVAVKCLRSDVFAENPDAVGSFCQEVELLSRHRHPYVLRMFAACLSPPDHAWIITEYLPSGTLTEWLHGTKTRERTRIAPLPPLSERLRIATEISVAMHCLHESSPKVLHRDLKPSNILLDENNHVRIADFNCARYFSDKDAALTGETGTYVYMAPEVMSHESYDEKCDIYSFGVILCELVTGTPPYADTNYSPAEIACKVAQGSLRPTLPENQPEMLIDLIQDAWEQKPFMRPSFSGITASLKAITGDFIDVFDPSMDKQE